MQHGPVLCVDDDPAILALLNLALRNHFDLAFARSGADALSAVRKHRPALILLDVDMPDMEGYEVCHRLKGHPESEDIPILFVTGKRSAEDEERGFTVGGVDYIPKPISTTVVLARVRTHLSLVRASQLEKSHLSAIFMLGQAGHYNDTDTGVHIWRMAAYSKALAAAVGWSAPNQHLMELAAPMHDTGKIGIPDAILKKPGPLDQAQWEVMRTHPRIGHEILSMGHGSVFTMAADIALGHHERWDGTGYPRGLAGTDISEAARIVAVADVFDALSVKRPYKDPWPHDKVVQTLRESAGSHLDPTLTGVFLDIMPEILDIQSQWNRYEATDSASDASLPIFSHVS